MGNVQFHVHEHELVVRDEVLKSRVYGRPEAMS